MLHGASAQSTKIGTAQHFSCQARCAVYFDPMEHVKAIFPRPGELAAMIGAEYRAVQAWYVRNSLPPRYNGAVIRAAAAAGHVLTLDELEAAHAARWAAA